LVARRIAPAGIFPYLARTKCSVIMPQQSLTNL